MDVNDVKTEFDQTFSTLLEKLATFDESKFNQKPSAEKWSAGQIAQHLITGNSGFSDLVSGRTKPAERAPDQMIEEIRNDFLNFGTSMSSPDFLIPEEKTYDQDELLAKLREIKSEAIRTAESKDLSNISLAFEFPKYGYLTGIEILAFATYHTQRHLWQLGRLEKAIG